MLVGGERGLHWLTQAVLGLNPLCDVHHHVTPTLVGNESDHMLRVGVAGSYRPPDCVITFQVSPVI